MRSDAFDGELLLRWASLMLVPADEISCSANPTTFKLFSCLMQHVNINCFSSLHFLLATFVPSESYQSHMFLLQSACFRQNRVLQCPWIYRSSFRVWLKYHP